MGDIREVGRVGAKALVYFEVVSSLALLLGLVAVNVLHPGRGMNIDAATLDPTAIASYASTAQHMGVVAFLLNIIPSSIGDPFVTGNILQIILLGVLFGLALTPIRSSAKLLVDLLDLLLKGMFGIVRMVMYLAPLAALGAMAYTVGQYGVASLLQLARFTADVWIVSLLFVVIVLGGIARIAGFSLTRLLVYLRDELLITAGTSSSEAVLAPLMLKLEQLGCAEPVVGMVMPAGYTFNADGTAIYLSMGAIFIAQATNMHLSLGEQITLMLVLMITSKGSAGVAGAGFVTLAATLASMHRIPVAGLVLLLGVERLTNIARAVVNVIGSSVATIVIAKWENAFDGERGRRIARGIQ
jgi:Na+/H+-dicarboxylate symporter